MASVTLSDYLLQSVVWFSLATLALMALLLLKIYRLRMSLIARTEYERQFVEIWQPLLTAAIVGETAALPPLAKGDEVPFLKLWNHLHETLRGKAKHELNIIALRCDMMQQAYALLRKKDLGSRLLALSTLGHLGDRHDWDDILYLTEQPDPLLSLAAARALFQIDAEAALKALEQPLLEREDWPAAQLAVLMQESGTDTTFGALVAVAVGLADTADRDELARLNRLLHLLEVAPYQQVIPAIRIILSQNRNNEIRAHCLKFLREPDDLHFVRDNIGHPDWIVRLQVARALGRFGTKGDILLLAALLGDPVWWVRYRAAQGVMVLTRGDADTLSGLRARLGDKYARDMLDMVAAEKEAR